VADRFTETVVEDAALDLFEELGYEVVHGAEIGPGESREERASFNEVLLAGRLRDAIDRLNRKASPAAREEAFNKVLRETAPSLILSNRAVHNLLVKGVEVETPDGKGGVRGELIRLVNFEEPGANDFAAVNQLTVRGHKERRPDIVVYVNGLPVGLLELKNAADEKADIWKAHQQLETYAQEIPDLLRFNAVLVIADGLYARMGAIGSGRERFQPWRSVDDEHVAPKGTPEMATLLRGVFEKSRFIDYLRHFIVFEEDEKGKITKKIAAYHQFHAVRHAVERTVESIRPQSDRRIGLIWHTQGSGKSLTMVFYAGKVILEPAMSNPTIVVITDRNDLDDQLFGTFAGCSDLLRQKPLQPTSRAGLREALKVASGGVVFATIQKFLPEERGDTFPMLSDRRNIIVVADEAHRSQYGFRSKVDSKKGDLVAGFAQHLRDALPNASFIGFTGTPVERDDRSTRNVFGDYISVYDIQRAVEDGATVPIFYESRLAKLTLPPDLKPKIDEQFEEVTEGEEEPRKQALISRWSQVEAVVGSDKRLEIVARDLVEHFEKRLEAIQGKAMFVAMSRRIAVDLYKEIIKLRPAWAAETVKIVMTGSAADPADWQQHIRSKSGREELAVQFKKPEDPFQLVIVRDMWLTGFDAPCLHTLYVDKPMAGHGLMQAIARVNRVFRDKPGGLVVDYIGLADNLRKALATYTESGGKGSTALDQKEAIAEMLKRHEICRDLFHGFDYQPFFTGKPLERLAVLPAAQEHILGQQDGKQRFVDEVTALSKAFALAVPDDMARAIRDEVAFFQAVKAALTKSASSSTGKPEADLDHAVRQIISNAVAPEGIVDVFTAAGLKKPDISILSDEFLAEIEHMPHRNLAVELLQKLLQNEIRTRTRSNLVQSKIFSDQLESAVRKYQNRAVETAQVIEELIQLAKDMKAAEKRGENLGLSTEETAFYDALETNDSAVKVLGEPVLSQIARELTKTIRENVSIDWTQKEAVKAKLRTLVRRLLRKYGYPPDLQEKATLTVLAQAELLAADWVIQ
jgi:type I restriction enzyme R subunit